MSVSLEANLSQQKLTEEEAPPIPERLIWNITEFRMGWNALEKNSIRAAFHVAGINTYI